MSTEIHWQIDVPCPICGSRNVEKLRQDTTWNYQFVECCNCSMRYYDRRMAEEYVVARFLHSDAAREEAENMFTNAVMYGKPEGTPEEQKAQLRTYYDFLLGLQTDWFAKENLGSMPRSLLEVGTSIGWFMKFGRERFAANDADLRVRGCDANSFAADLGRERFGFDIFAGTFQAMPAVEGERYDLVTALDYIEHTYTPLEDLRKMQAMANPGGILFIKTFIEEMDSSGSYIHPVFHANHFSARALKLAVERAGWRILEFDDERERVFAQASLFAVKPH